MNKGMLLAISLCGLAGCSTLPSEEKMASLPVVEWGQAVPKEEFILHMPAGKPIATHASIKGDIFSKTDEKTLEVTLAKDIYLYKDYVSRDRKVWQKSTQVFKGNFDIQLPSTERPAPGIMSVELNERKPD